MKRTPNDMSPEGAVPHYRAAGGQGGRATLKLVSTPSIVCRFPRVKLIVPCTVSGAKPAGLLLEGA